ncbi:MAG: lysophospholipid acyltransferase family protein [Acidobacteria bacterium]|nr:lysophospholipid acyltransferase family protein [Acidobacteriota bacterium]
MNIPDTEMPLQDKGKLEVMMAPLTSRMPRFIRGLLGKILNVEELDYLYRHISSQSNPQKAPETLLELLGISYEISSEDLKRLPKTGPLIVTANHPFGIIEGLVLASVLRSVRRDVKILANSILEPVEELRDLFIYVDAFGGLDAAHRNYRPVREAIRWLEGGRVLAAFPAGEVAHVQFNRASVTDPKWKDTVARLARKIGIPVLPVYFCGTNSLVFHILGLMHPRVRTALLAREMLNKRNRILEVRTGRVISLKRLRDFGTDREATEYLRKRTYLLSHRFHAGLPPSGGKNTKNQKKYCKVPTDPASDPEDLEAEIMKLERTNFLIERGGMLLAYADACEIPLTLYEIGRLRECTFRSVGEGSGKEIDLDVFDRQYQHLFLWDLQKKRIAGAYRLGRTDRILARSGFNGLYVNTLFRLGRSFFTKLGPALELGRSFIRLENQRDSRSLPMLWAGIARFVARHPQYRYLYGPVSISGDYRPISRELIAWYLRLNHPEEALKFKINPMTPPSFNRFKTRAARNYCKSVRDLDELSDLISDIEPDSKGVPVLLRHYIRLGAKTLAFNLDPEFGNCLDALVIIDLAHLNPAILERMMGKTASENFRRHHHVPDGKAPGFLCRN